MWKIAVGFVVFAGLAMFVIMKGGDNLDMGGEKHGAEAVHASRRRPRPPPSPDRGRPSALELAVAADDGQVGKPRPVWSSGEYTSSPPRSNRMPSRATWIFRARASDGAAQRLHEHLGGREGLPAGLIRRREPCDTFLQEGMDHSRGTPARPVSSAVFTPPEALLESVHLPHYPPPYKHQLIPKSLILKNFPTPNSTLYTCPSQNKIRTNRFLIIVGLGEFFS